MASFQERLAHFFRPTPDPPRPGDRFNGGHLNGCCHAITDLYKYLDCAFRRWMQWSLQPAAATSVNPICICNLNLEQSMVYRKSHYVTAARCIPAAECTVQKMYIGQCMRPPTSGHTTSLLADEVSGEMLALCVVDIPQRYWCEHVRTVAGVARGLRNSHARRDGSRHSNHDLPDHSQKYERTWTREGWGGDEEDYRTRRPFARVRSHVRVRAGSLIVRCTRQFVIQQR